MLVQFIVSNYRSINEEQEFSMVAGSTRNHYDHIADCGGVKLLKGSALYGSNSAGKTSLIRAFLFSKRMITKGMVAFDDEKDYCRTKKENANKASHFEYLIEMDGELYYYGFEILLSQSKFLCEWLYKRNMKKDEDEVIFDINYGTETIDISYFESNDEDTSKLNFYQESAANDGLLLLKQVGKTKSIDDSSNLMIIKKIYLWFKDKLIIRNSSVPNRGEECDEEYIGKFNKLAKMIGLDIEKTTLVEKDASDLDDMLSQFISRRERIVLNSPGRSIKKDGENITVSEISIKHNSSESDFSLADESDGTLELYRLAPQLFPNTDNVTIIIDEFGSKLHPLVAPKVIETFYKQNSDNKCQLIVATHQTSIMTPDIYRPDEIWLVDKKDGESLYYSLEEFKIRPDTRWDRQYLEGRFGALAIFDDSVNENA